MLDFLSDFECPELDINLAVEPDAVIVAVQADAVVPVEADNAIAVRQALVQAREASHSIKTAESVSVSKHKFRFKPSSMAGKVGRGRHGGAVERHSLTSHMRHVKASRKFLQWTSSLESAIDVLESKNNGRRLNRYSLKRSRCGNNYVLNAKAWKGNRFMKTYPNSWYLSSAFHNRDYPGVSRSQARTFSRVTSMGLMTLQLNILAKIATMVRSNNALSMVTRFKWDEASQQFRLRVRANKQVDATWNIMVAKLKFAIEFADNVRIVMSVVLPPSLICGLTAEDMYCQHEHHPLFKGVWRAIRYLEERSDASMRLYGVTLIHIAYVSVFRCAIAGIQRSQ